MNFLGRREWLISVGVEGQTKMRVLGKYQALNLTPKILRETSVWDQYIYCSIVLINYRDCRNLFIYCYELISYSLFHQNLNFKCCKRLLRSSISKYKEKKLICTLIYTYIIKRKDCLRWIGTKTAEPIRKIILLLES